MSDALRMRSDEGDQPLTVDGDARQVNADDHTIKPGEIAIGVISGHEGVAIRAHERGVEVADLGRHGRARDAADGRGDYRLAVAESEAAQVFACLLLRRRLEEYGTGPEVFGLVHADLRLANLLVEVQIVPDLPQLAGMRIRHLEIDEVPLLSLL